MLRHHRAHRSTGAGGWTLQRIACKSTVRRNPLAKKNAQHHHQDITAALARTNELSVQNKVWKTQFRTQDSIAPPSYGRHFSKAGTTANETLTNETAFFQLDCAPWQHKEAVVSGNI